MLEDRYIVLKRADVEKFLPNSLKATLAEIVARVNMGRAYYEKDPVKSIVIEHDWPEYRRVCDMLEWRINSEEN